MDDLHRIYGELPADPDAMAISKGAPAPGSTTHTSPLESVPYTIDEAIADSIEQLTGEPFPDPFIGDHDIQYWIWTGDRLVPASPEAAERIRQQELLEQAEIRHQRECQLASRQQRLETTRRFARRLLAPIQHLVERWRGIDRGTRQNHDIIESTVSGSSSHSE
jgi:hypothetical protein